MYQPGSISQVISTIQNAWISWISLIKQFDNDQLTLPDIAGDWSVKDIIAHITWHEKEMVGMITAHALVGSDLWNLPTDERNVAIYELVKDQPLEQVLAESEQVHQQLMDALPSLSDAVLTDPSTFPNMPPDWQPWMIIAQNTYEHYEDHIRDVEKWLEERDSSLRSE